MAQTPFDQNQLDQDALMKQMGAANEPAIDTSMGVGGPTSTTMPVGGTTQQVTPVATKGPTADAPKTGFGGMQLGPVEQRGGTFRGFNDDRALSGGDPNSIKDGFRRVVGGLGLDMNGKSMQDVGGMRDAQIIPALQAAGIQARVAPGMSGDQMEVFSQERGWEPIDFAQNAGGADSAFQWLDLMGDQGQGQPQVQTGGAPSRTGNTGISGGLDLSGGIQSDDQALQRVLAEIQALQGGGGSPMEQDALMQLLRG